MRAVAFAKKEMTLTISLAAMLISCFIVHPDRAYSGYIDTSVIIMLSVLMGVSSGLRRSGFFSGAASSIFRISSSSRAVSALMILLVFFSSMLVTNDVALIMYVPLTLSMLDGKTGEKTIARIIVLETIAANLGSMATPFGNPQNLYIYSYFSLNPSSFFSSLSPYSAISLVLLIALVPVLIGKGELMKSEDRMRIDRKMLTLHALLFASAILAVFDVLGTIPLLLLAASAFILFDRQAFREIDYALILTFVCFFIFSGNLARIPAVESFLSSIAADHAFPVSLAASQIISNVPSAVLLSPFTSDWKGLLLGTDIGGLGTPIASLASLISLKLYFQRADADSKGYIIRFEALNILFLAVLIATKVGIS